MILLGVVVFAVVLGTGYLAVRRIRRGTATIAAHALRSRQAVVTVQGVVAPGVTIDTEPEPERFVVQIRLPSNVIPLGSPPRLVATVVAAPAGWVGSIR